MLLYFIAFATVGSALGQFFYTGLPTTPAVNTYYHNPQYLTPSPYIQPYSTQFFSRPTYYVQPTNFITAQPVQQTYPQQDQPQAQQEQQQEQQQDQLPVVEANRRIASESASTNFRGFAYHNQFETGRSDVVFLTGPEIHRLSQSAQDVNTKSSSHTPASDALDKNAVTIESADNTARENPSFRAIMDFFEHPQSGVQKFYSFNNQIIARSLEEEAQQMQQVPSLPQPILTPAGTTLYKSPVSPIFPLLKQRFGNYVENNDDISPIQSRIAEDDVSTSTAATSSSPTTTAAASTEASTTTTVPSSTTSTTTTTTEPPKSSSMEPIVVEDN
jgi:hypothetical protein